MEEFLTLTITANKFVSSLILLSCAVVRVWLLSRRRQGTVPAVVSPALFALGKLALIMGYFYVCDRTTLFMKESKYYSRYTFWIPVIYILCVGLFFTEDSRSSKVLHRDQTDEWKGKASHNPLGHFLLP